MKYTKHCLTAFMAIIISLMVWADRGELFTSGKLSSSLINCIVQDKYGYIWVGTEYGLSKFDGYRFTNYLHNEEDTTSITDNICPRNGQESYPHPTYCRLRPYPP